MALIIKHLPELLAIRLLSSVLLLDLTRIHVIEQGFLGVVLGDFDLIDGYWVKEGRDDLPSEVDSTRSVDGEHLEESSTVIGAHLCCSALDGRHRNLSHSHSSQIVNDDPVLHLPRNEHILDDLLMD